VKVGSSARRFSIDQRRIDSRVVPLFGVFWRTYDPMGRRFPAATKMLLGFIFTAGAAGVMSLAGYAAEHKKEVMIANGVVPKDFTEILIKRTETKTGATR